MSRQIRADMAQRKNPTSDPVTNTFRRYIREKAGVNAEWNPDRQHNVSCRSTVCGYACSEQRRQKQTFSKSRGVTAPASLDSPRCNLRRRALHRHDKQATWGGTGRAPHRQHSDPKTHRPRDKKHPARWVIYVLEIAGTDHRHTSTTRRIERRCEPIRPLFWRAEWPMIVTRRCADTYNKARFHRAI